MAIQFGFAETITPFNKNTKYAEVSALLCNQTGMDSWFSPKIYCTRHPIKCNITAKGQTVVCDKGCGGGEAFVYSDDVFSYRDH